MHYPRKIVIRKRLSVRVRVRVTVTVTVTVTVRVRIRVRVQIRVNKKRQSFIFKNYSCTLINSGSMRQGDHFSQTKKKSEKPVIDIIDFE